MTIEELIEKIKKSIGRQHEATDYNEGWFACASWVLPLLEEHRRSQK